MGGLPYLILNNSQYYILHSLISRYETAYDLRKVDGTIFALPQQENINVNHSMSRMLS